MANNQHAGLVFKGILIVYGQTWGRQIMHKHRPKLPEAIGVDWHVYLVDLEK
jgi:hypothetical protein